MPGDQLVILHGRGWWAPIKTPDGSVDPEQRQRARTRESARDCESARDAAESSSVTVAPGCAGLETVITSALSAEVLPDQ